MNKVEALSRWLSRLVVEAVAPPEDGSLARAAAASNAAWSAHSVTGSAAAQAMSLDAAYRQSNSLADLQASPATGAAQLMTLAMQRSGYDPSNPATAGSVTAFNNYVAQVLTCPLFSTILNDTISPLFSGSWPSIVSQMASYFEGIADSDLSILEASMLQLGNAASSQQSTLASLNLVAQSAINMEGVAIDVFIYQTFIKMIATVHRGGKREPDTISNQAWMQLHRVKLSFDAVGWPALAVIVQKETDSTLKSWADANSPLTSTTPTCGLFKGARRTA